MPNMDSDASDPDLPDLVLSSAAHSRSFAPTVHGSANRNTGGIIQVTGTPSPGSRAHKPNLLVNPEIVPTLNEGR